MGATRLIKTSMRIQQYQGEDVHIIVECNLSTKGMSVGGVNTMSKIWPMRKSELQRDISTILTTNSRAGCERAELPRPRPYHLPDHQARLVSSCLYSRERNTEMRIFWIAR